jgi:hypothetical protein
MERRGECEDVDDGEVGEDRDREVVKGKRIGHIGVVSGSEDTLYKLGMVESVTEK